MFGGREDDARALAYRLGAEHVELDAIFHRPGWTPLPLAEFRARLTQRLGATRWITDGNYDSSVQDIVLARADTVVWLDLPRPAVMRAVIGRTLRRVIRRQELWNGNRERWSNLCDPRPKQNIILWSFTRHAKYRATYERKSADPAFAHIHWHRLRSRREVDRFLATVTQAPGTTTWGRPYHELRRCTSPPPAGTDAAYVCQSRG